MSCTAPHRNPFKLTHLQILPTPSYIHKEIKNQTLKHLENVLIWIHLLHNIHTFYTAAVQIYKNVKLFSDFYSSVLDKVVTADDKNSVKKSGRSSE